MYSTWQDILDAFTKKVDDSVQAEDFVEWMNVGKNIIVAKIIQERESYFRRKGTLSVAGSTEEITLASNITPTPEGIIQLIRLEDADGAKITRKDINAKDYDGRLGYNLIGTEKISIDPTLSADESWTIYYIDKPAKIATISDTIPASLPTGYLSIFKDYAAYEYFDSADYGDDEEMAILKLNIFNAKLKDMMTELDNDEAETDKVEVIPDGLE